MGTIIGIAVVTIISTTNLAYNAKFYNGDYALLWAVNISMSAGALYYIFEGRRPAIRASALFAFVLLTFVVGKTALTVQPHTPLSVEEVSDKLQAIRLWGGEFVYIITWNLLVLLAVYPFHLIQKEIVEGESS